MIKHEGRVYVIDEFQHFHEPQEFIKCDPLVKKLKNDHPEFLSDKENIRKCE